METRQDSTSLDLTVMVIFVQSKIMVPLLLYETQDLQYNWGNTRENSVAEVRLCGGGFESSGSPEPGAQSLKPAHSRCPLVLAFLGLPLTSAIQRFIFSLEKNE